MLAGLAIGLSIWIILIQLPWSTWTPHVVWIDTAAFIGGMFFATSVGGQALAIAVFFGAITLTLLMRASRLIYRWTHK